MHFKYCRACRRKQPSKDFEDFTFSVIITLWVFIISKRKIQHVILYYKTHKKRISIFPCVFSRNPLIYRIKPGFSVTILKIGTNMFSFFCYLLLYLNPDRKFIGVSWRVISQPSTAERKQQMKSKILISKPVSTKVQVSSRDANTAPIFMFFNEFVLHFVNYKYQFPKCFYIYP